MDNYNNLEQTTSGAIDLVVLAIGHIDHAVSRRVAHFALLDLRDHRLSQLPRVLLPSRRVELPEGRVHRKPQEIELVKPLPSGERSNGKVAAIALPEVLKEYSAGR